MKKFLSGFFGILFVLLVIAGITIATYVYNQPSRVGAPRELINGSWTDPEKKVTFVFDTEGHFTMVKANEHELKLIKDKNVYTYNSLDKTRLEKVGIEKKDVEITEENTLVKGYFKVDEDAKKIKLLIWPGDKSDDVAAKMNLKMFTSISYIDMTIPDLKDVLEPEKLEYEKKIATCKFIFNESDEVYATTRIDTEDNVYKSR